MSNLEREEVLEGILLTMRSTTSSKQARWEYEDDDKDDNDNKDDDDQLAW